MFSTLFPPSSHQTSRALSLLIVLCTVCALCFSLFSLSAQAATGDDTSTETDIEVNTPSGQEEVEGSISDDVDKDVANTATAPVKAQNELTQAGYTVTDDDGPTNFIPLVISGIVALLGFILIAYGSSSYRQSNRWAEREKLSDTAD